MAESEETTSIPFLDDSFEANLITGSEKAAYLHNIKERLRHQKIQSILEHVGKHVPKPSCIKKETKARCLRRVVLYMKFLLQKSEELKLLPDSTIEDSVSNVPVVVSKRGRKKKNENLSKKHFVPKINCRKAQIIFLKKFTGSSIEKFSSPVEAEPNHYAEQDVNSYNAEVKAELGATENSFASETQGLLKKKFDASSLEAATAVATICNQEKTLPLQRSYLHNSSQKICTASFTDDHNTVGQKMTGSILSKNPSLKRSIINSMKRTRGKRMQVKLGLNSDPMKQNSRRKNVTPSCFKKTNNKPDCNGNVSLPSISKVFTMPSFSINTVESASKPESFSFLAADTNNTFSTRVTTNSNIPPFPLNKHPQVSSSCNDLYSSLLSKLYPDDQDAFPSDFLSSSETTTIPSSNEFISDDTDYHSFTKSESMESPDIIGSGSSEENKVHTASYETLSDIESFIRNESLSKSPCVKASSYVPAPKSNYLYQNLNVLNSEKPFVMSGFDFNYGVTETPTLLNCSFIPQPMGIVSDDLLNVPDYFYMYPNIENTHVLLSNDVVGSQSDEFPPGMNLDFCETFSEPTMYSDAQPSTSLTCDMLKNVQIKQEILDVLPDEEISGSLNHLGDFNW